MADFTNYQESSGAMLMLDTQQRAIGTKPATANGNTSVGEPPSPLINVGDGSRFHQHLPPSNRQHHHGGGHLHHAQTAQPKDQQHPLPLFYQAQQQQHLTGEHSQESFTVRKGSSSSLNLVHEDPAAAVTAAAAIATTSQQHAYAAASLSGAASIAASASVSVSTSDVVDDIRKCGYLRKQKHGHKRFFVLRAASHLGPSRLEYYDSEKKFRNCLRSAAASAASGAVAPSPPKRVIYLYQCFTVNKRADSKNKHLIALYTKDDYFAIVAENEQEQEDWYVALSELMSEGKRPGGHGLDSDDLDDGYGTVTPGTVFKEVWQVNVKPKGLGQTKNLTGVYRLCLSSKTVHLVKLNSETPCVNLQLMNIRRCGHSESFFFIEVGRSSSIGPGEIWMQVDDSVVAQSMHETILETMKALKAFAEFRPRSKSQSSGSNPIAFITTRRHLGNLPPSQTGLQRRSRTESSSSSGTGAGATAGGTGTPPSSKSSGASGYRFRTSSEGEGTMGRPFRSVTGSLVHLGSARIHMGRQESGCGGGGGGGVALAGSGGGRYMRAMPNNVNSAGSSGGSAYHARSASLPVSHFPSTTSPVSVSSSSGHGSVSDTLTRPSSASICGSPSDGGFNSSDEYGSSPGDFRYFRVRSGTPDSLGNTPPIREEHCLSDYMAMGWHREVFGVPAASARDDMMAAAKDESTSTGEDDRSSSSSSSLRRRTHSFSRNMVAGGGSGASSGGVAVYQKMTQTAGLPPDDGSGLDGSGLLSLGRPPSSSSSSLRSDYSSCSEHSQGRPPAPPSFSSSAAAREDSGYMPMMCGVASASPRDTPPGIPGDYMPMQPSSSHHSPLLLHSPALAQRSNAPQSNAMVGRDAHGYMMMLPGGVGRASSSSPVQATPSPRSGGGGDISDRPDNGEYMDMTCNSGGGGVRKASNDGYYALSTPDAASKSYSPYFSLPRSYKAPPARGRQEAGGCREEYVPMSSPAKPVFSCSSSCSSSTSSSTPERRIGGGGVEGIGGTPPSHPPPPYGAQHVTGGMGADRRAVRPNRLPLGGRRSFRGSFRAEELSPDPVPAAVPATTEGPSSPGEYINIEFGDRFPHSTPQPHSTSSTPSSSGPPPLPHFLAAQVESPQQRPRPSPHQDYMSVEVGAGKSQSPRPSLVAPWNPPSYIRPLASSSGVSAPSSSPGVAGAHWKTGGGMAPGEDYTDMNFGVAEAATSSPTALLQHLCVMEGRYGPPAALPPTAASGTGTQPSSTDRPPPRVVRADPQGRRRHSSETFTATAGQQALPPSNSTAPNGAATLWPEGSRCTGSGSFDSVWMCVEAAGESAARAPRSPVSSDGSMALPGSSSSGGRTCRNPSPGYQNGLNYIALELREETVATMNAATMATMAAAVTTGNSSIGASGAFPENGAYASIDFTKTDGVTAATTKD